VGLVGKDFCILNEQYDRAEYFQELRHLLAELDLPAP
jgi:hypothetical protein